MSRLEDALAAGRFVVTSELLSVDSGGLDAVHERFAPYEAYVDATNATDNTSAHAHASPLAVAIALKQLGMEPILQLTCRDRNRLALEAELAGAALHGIENVLCLTGDDVTAGDEPEARRVFDLDSIQLLALGAAMARGTYLSGRKIDPAPKLFLGAVENSGAPPYDYRVDRALKKARAGARFLQLQVSFRPEQLEAFFAEALEKGLAEQCALLPTICLTRSPAALRYIDEHVPGIEVPAALDQRRRPRGGVLRGRVRARPARALPAGSRRTPPDQLPPRGRHRRTLRAARHTSTNGKGDEWTRSSSRRLGRSSSGRSSRSA
jgi:methylenetetrahydrofolate reductase (NADPH)